MNTLKAIVLLTISTVLLGCAPDESSLVESIDMGAVIDANLVPTSFNESIKSTIKTEKGIFLIRGMPSVYIGDIATLNKYDDGSSYLCIDSWRTCRRVRF